MSQRLSKPFWPPALASQAPPAIILAVLHRFRGPALFRGLRTSSRLDAPFWPSGLTRRSSRPAYGGRLTLAVKQRGSQQMSDAEWSVADAAVKGVITVVFLYLVFAVCRWVWRTLIRGVRAAQRHAPTALENTAKVAGKATKEASTLASKLKKAVDEGRK